MSGPAEDPSVVLARIEVKLDHALVRGEDHEKRIRVLEQDKWKLYGFAAALSVAGGSIASRLFGG